MKLIFYKWLYPKLEYCKAWLVLEAFRVGKYIYDNEYKTYSCEKCLENTLWTKRSNENTFVCTQCDTYADMSWPE